MTASRKRELEPESALNDTQRLRLSVSCRYIDRLLGDIEKILHAAGSRSPFDKYIVDISPAQTRVLEDYIHRLRDQLLRSLAWQQLEPDAPTISATHAILTHLSFIDIAVEELRPRHMRGSGVVNDKVADELNGVVHELRSLLEGMNRYLRQEIMFAIAYRGLEGFGANAAIHRQTVLSGSKAAPIMMTIIDRPEKIEKFIPILDRTVEKGLIAISSVEVIRLTKGGSGSKDT
jgi:PII-like signaling protein